jgi:hypothetical protein
MAATWPAHGAQNTWDALLYAYISGPGQNPITGMFHATAYGDGTRKTSNVNLALTAAKVAGGTVYMDAGAWTCDAVIDMTLINQNQAPYTGSVVKLLGAGHQETIVSGGVAGFGFLELTGSARVTVEGISFVQTTGSSIQYGILGGRYTDNGSVLYNLKDVYVSGNYTLAAMITYSAEDSQYADCVFYNNQGPGLVLARDQRGWSVTPKYAAVSTSSPLSSGNGQIRLSRVKCFTTRNATNGPADYPLVVEFAQSFVADNIYTISGGAPLILIDKRCDQVSFRGLHQEWWTSGVTGATEPYGTYIKATVTAGENLYFRLTYDASTIYPIFAEDNTKVTQLSVRGCGWRSSTRSWMVDLYEADTVDVPSGNGWTAISTGEQTTPTYRKRAGTSLVVALPHSILRANSGLDFPSVTANGGTQTLTITVTGAATGDDATVHWDTLGPPAGLISEAWVSAANTVTVRVTNVTTAAINPVAATVRVNVFKFA